MLLVSPQVFQRREDGSVNFFRGWEAYRDGFGKLTGEHWLGVWGWQGSKPALPGEVWGFLCDGGDTETLRRAHVSWE